MSYPSPPYPDDNVLDVRDLTELEEDEMDRVRREDREKEMAEREIELVEFETVDQRKARAGRSHCTGCGVFVQDGTTRAVDRDLHGRKS